jgi:hypothetical protein
VSNLLIQIINDKEFKVYKCDIVQFDIVENCTRIHGIDSLSLGISSDFPEYSLNMKFKGSIFEEKVSKPNFSKSLILGIENFSTEDKNKRPYPFIGIGCNKQISKLKNIRKIEGVFYPDVINIHLFAEGLSTHVLKEFLPECVFDTLAITDIGYQYSEI